MFSSYRPQKSNLVFLWPRWRKNLQIEGHRRQYFFRPSLWYLFNLRCLINFMRRLGLSDESLLDFVLLLYFLPGSDLNMLDKICKEHTWFSALCFHFGTATRFHFGTRMRFHFGSTKWANASLVTQKTAHLRLCLTCVSYVSLVSRKTAHLRLRPSAQMCSWERGGVW